MPDRIAEEITKQLKGNELFVCREPSGFRGDFGHLVIYKSFGAFSHHGRREILFPKRFYDASGKLMRLHSGQPDNPSDKAVEFEISAYF